MSIEERANRNRQRLNSIVDEIDNLKQYYELGQKIYSYKNLEQNDSTDEHVARISALNYENLSSGKALLWNSLAYGVLSTYGFTKMM